MKLKDARKLTGHHPPASERLTMLGEQLAAFRRDFYGHLQALGRCEAWEAQGITEIAPSVSGLPHSTTVEAIRTQSEDALDVLAASIDRAQAEIAEIEKQLKAVDPDA